MEPVAASAASVASTEACWHDEGEPAPVPCPPLRDLLPADAVRPIPGGGFVRLIDVLPRLGGEGLTPESAVAQAARTSFGPSARKLSDDRALLRFLLRHEHLTPFEMVVLKFQVEVPLYTAVQWLRHRSGSFNMLSARYSRIPAAFFEPPGARGPSAANAQGSGALLPEEAQAEFAALLAEAYAGSAAAYDRALALGVARETARLVLPEGRMTRFVWQVNLRNLFAFVRLRADPAAQENIRDCAGAVLELVRLYCPDAVAAFEDFSLHGLALSRPEVEALRALLAGAASEGALPGAAPLPARMSARERAEWAAKLESLGVPQN